MPFYDYQCEDCGPFTAFAPLSQFAAPCDCPECSSASPRVLLTAPRVSGLSTQRRNAFETNERSADSPKRTSTHGPGCGCCSGGQKVGKKTLVHPDGSKSFPTKRPWMISH
ncbi:FmdB family zinc ribbon protein [Meridianimarinicoccus aquatilis]|uniref:Zinc ribbon domain-containing protein n=1 Tax=Meridianimarinicoccus aquatilis TaxID=2552766 RepID=A0A4R6ASD4_9RHOB|nr:zinc ribbon domain-containing protein [Fluviibacterium aquatile]QIE43351.1 zinc ribbon domain-containing protein [Rhodobacteraceae bacterium SC52]TDL87060.1 zinc ribbon domain-containing protein [Fluviibacterium aquatile]